MKNHITRFILIALLMQCSMGALLAKAIIPRVNTATDLPGKQLLVVVADGWDNLQGTLYGFKKRHHKWVLQFSNPVVLGRKGLGMGDGMIPMVIDGAPVKKEGDLKSPAGIFSIGTAFGYADHQQARWIKNPYVKATDTLICVDDMQSTHYNTLVHIDTTKNDWKSHEEMHRPDVYYKWGLFVNHNAHNPKAGDGSCIFMHIWENDHQGTTGCTAMKEADILRILHWIKARKKPILVQLPKNEYNKYRDQYHLPQIDF